MLKGITIHLKAYTNFFIDLVLYVQSGISSFVDFLYKTHFLFFCSAGIVYFIIIDVENVADCSYETSGLIVIKYFLFKQSKLQECFFSD